MKTITRCALVLLLAAPYAEAKPSADADTTAVREALYAGRVAPIHAAFAEQGLVDKIVARSGTEGLRLLILAVDMLPRAVLQDDGGATWTGVADSMKAVAKSVGGKAGAQFGQWAENEALLFRHFLALRRGETSDVDHRNALEMISRSEPGGHWDLECYLRASGIALRMHHVKDTNQWMTILKLLYFKRKMERRPRKFPREGIPIVTAGFKYGEVHMDVRREKRNIDKSRASIEEGMKLLAPFVNGEGARTETIARYNDLARLAKSMPELELSYAAKSAPVVLGEDSAPIARGSLQHSVQWQVHEFQSASGSTWRIWYTTEDGQLLREYTLRALSADATYEFPSAMKPIKGTDRKALTRAWVARAESNFAKVGRRTKPSTRAFNKSLKGVFVAGVDGTSHDNRPLQLNAYFVRGKKHTVVIEVLNYGKPADKLPSDVAAFEASITVS